MGRNFCLILSIIVVLASSQVVSGESSDSRSRKHVFDIRTLYSDVRTLYSERYSDFDLVEAKYFPSDSAWVRRPTHKLEHLEGFVPGSKSIPLDKFGGRTDIQMPKTGFFHVKKIDGRWWFITPEGHPYYNVGVSRVKPLDTPEAQQALIEKFGTEENWYNSTINMLKGYGFTAIGGFTGGYSKIDAVDDYIPNNRFPYTIMLRTAATFAQSKGLTPPNDFRHFHNHIIPVFHEDFEDYCRQYIEEQISDYVNDPYLIGYYSDNELTFHPNALQIMLGLDDASDPSRIAAEKWLKENGVDRGSVGLSSETRRAFVAYYVETYFRIITKALREIDPNHMYFGHRMHNPDKYRPEVWKSAGKYMDAIAYNMYREWTPRQEMMDMWYKASGRPFLITEWYAKTEEAGKASGLDNHGGWGWYVMNMKDRTAFYHNFALALMQHPACVGWHWFEYLDDRPSGVHNSNKGVVDNRYNPYTEFLEGAREINKEAYNIIDFMDK